MVLTAALERIARQAFLTLGYSDQFEYPLSSLEIARRLIGESVSTPTGVDKALQQLHKAGLIDKTDQYYHLPGRQELVKIRLQRTQASAQKQFSVQQFLRLVRFIPWIKGVAITGSLAVANARPESDIDFMIVTQPHRVWLTRLVVLLVTTIMGKRRTSRGELPDSWCFNIWLDMNTLAVPAHKRSLYTAYEVCQADWVYDVAGVQHRFYSENGWAQRYIPQYVAERLQQATGQSTVRSQYVTAAPILRGLIGVLLFGINYASFLLQKMYMYPHLTRELVYEDMAYFHPRDTQGLVYTRWQNALRQSQ
jgi:hypothetical protein